MVRFYTTAFLALTALASISAFSVVAPLRTSSTTSTSSVCLSAMMSRRDMVFAATATAASLALPLPALAASTDVPTAADFDRVKVGYSGIRYLLDNFEQETTKCRDNGGECKRDADAVRKAMGLRSTTDPLFQIEKVFAKVKNMDDLDPDKLDEFFEASEDWNSCMAMSNSMAFISQFGEYNPGGGKDEVLKYLEESRKQVIMAEKALTRIMDALDIAKPQ